MELFPKGSRVHTSGSYQQLQQNVIGLFSDDQETVEAAKNRALLAVADAVQEDVAELEDRYIIMALQAASGSGGTVYYKLKR